MIKAANGIAPQRLPNGNFVPQLSGGMSAAILESAMGTRAAAPLIAQPPVIRTNGCSNVFHHTGRPDNVRANQDCGFRFQSEEWVAVNPTDPQNIVASQNDSKLNGNSTGVDYSLDGGKHWGDSTLPVRRHTIPEAPGGVWSWDAYSDPAHAFDSQGNLYYITLGFDFAQGGFDGVFAWKSNSCLKGSALHSPGSGSCAPFSPPLSAGSSRIRTNFANPKLSDDKELVAADAWPSSPFKDSVYVTWTIFDFSCGSGADSYCQSPIYFSRSTNGAVTWSKAKIISGVSKKYCHFADQFNSALNPNSCNFDQGSYPVVGPDGTIYVTFGNQNTTTDAVNGIGAGQQLFVKSTDGGTTWSKPVKVADDVATQPYSVPGNAIPDCPLFRQCLPPNGYRMNDFPSMGIDATTGKLAVYWSDFRNGGPCATDPTYGVPVLPCDNINNDVFVAESSDGGATWGPAYLVSKNGKGESEPAAQWQNWGDVGKDGALYVGYYDRKYGDCETTGCNDITLAKSVDDGLTWSYKRITTDSMPNLPCSVNPAECGFLGDYMSIQVSGDFVNLVWGDARGHDGTTEEDVYFAKTPA